MGAMLVVQLVVVGRGVLQKRVRSGLLRQGVLVEAMLDKIYKPETAWGCGQVIQDAQKTLLLSIAPFLAEQAL